MSYHYFAMLSRMKHINRWGLMRNTRAENLSEHSLETAFIAHALCVINNKRFGGNLNPERAAVLAMFHDTTEIITGDMPTPIKYSNEKIRSVYKEIEKTAEDQLLSLLPSDFTDAYKEVYETEDEYKRIIRAADKISALIKCIEEGKAGNTEFSVAEQSTLKAVKNLELPEAEVFIEEFLGSYRLTLDEQKANT